MIKIKRRTAVAVGRMTVDDFKDEGRYDSQRLIYHQSFHLVAPEQDILTIRLDYHGIFQWKIPFL